MITIKSVKLNGMQFVETGNNTDVQNWQEVYQFANQNPEGMFFGYDGDQKAVAVVGGVLWWNDNYAVAHDIPTDDEDLYAQQG